MAENMTRFLRNIRYNGIVRFGNPKPPCRREIKLQHGGRASVGADEHRRRLRDGFPTGRRCD